MSATIKYDEDGAIAPEDQKPKTKAEREEEAKRDAAAADYNPELTAEQREELARAAGEHTGTAETNGDVDPSSTISPVFEEAREHFANTDVPEGLAYAPDVDPAASGKHAAEPDYSNVEVDESGRAVNSDTGEILGEPTGQEPTIKDKDLPNHGDTEDGKAEDGDDEDGEFDPNEHTVSEVNDYLKDADEAEADRVLKAERKGGKRKGILGE